MINGNWTEEKGASCGVIDFDSMVASRKSPGIVIVDGQNKIVHVNSNAWDVLALLREQGTVSGDALMPTVLLQVCHAAQAHVRENLESPAPANADMVRLIMTSKGHVLLRALTLEGGSKLSPHKRRVLVLLEQVVERSHGSAELKERFGLTDREYAVARILVKGYTNKEIGNALNISEPTVKAHLNHIMQKLKCSTRTGVVSLMMGSTSVS